MSTGNWPVPVTVNSNCFGAAAMSGGGGRDEGGVRVFAVVVQAGDHEGGEVRGHLVEAGPGLLGLVPAEEPALLGAGLVGEDDGGLILDVGAVGVVLGGGDVEGVDQGAHQVP